jgi:AcrR family transcriptional regulator
MPTAQAPAKPRRREIQREETRRDLAIAAFELAEEQGLANVRVPEIAAATGVSTRTFNNYFPSKEAAVVWPAVRRAGRLAENLLARPEPESLATALQAAVGEMYGSRQRGDMPREWLRRFRALVAREPALLGEYLKVSTAGERALAAAIAERTGAGENELSPKVLAAVVVGAERAAVMHWMRQADKSTPLADTVLTAVKLALSEVH